jgi:hypothetical protein
MQKWENGKKSTFFNKEADIARLLFFTKIFMAAPGAPTRYIVTGPGISTIDL